MTVFNFKRLAGLLLILLLAYPAGADEAAAPAAPLFPSELSRDLGLQDPDQGALPNDFWQAIPAGDILPLIDQLPAHHAFNIAQQLQLRLLLSTARPPNGTTPQIWLAHRLQKLVAMRAFQPAAQLYYAAWRDQPMPDNAQLALATLHIAANEGTAACLRYLAARTAVQNLAWQYVQSYCAHLEPKLVSAPNLPTGDLRAALLPKLDSSAAARADFADAMLPVFAPNPIIKPASDDAPPPPAPLTGVEWLQNNTSSEPALMHLHGLLALAEGKNKNLVHQRWQANALKDEAQSLYSGKLPAPPPEE